jgi:hypothetical protein
MTVRPLGSAFEQIVSASSLPKMVIDGIGCNLVQPVAKLLFVTVEKPELLNDLEKNLRGHIFGRCSFKKPMSTVAKYRIVVHPIQPNKSFGVTTGPGY